MKQTESTLIEQMRITEFEIDHRQALLALTDEDFKRLKQCKPLIEPYVDELVEQFYHMQTDIPEIALLIGDAETLQRLKQAQRRYIFDLFGGVYDMAYVNNRLRIGLVHKRIGVEPKLYLSAVTGLKGLLFKQLEQLTANYAEAHQTMMALDRLLSFDVSLVFETYIRSLVSEIEIGRKRTEDYATQLESKVKERTRLLEEMMRTDPLTGLSNVRYLEETLLKMLNMAQRRGEPVSVVYIDVNKFKEINDNDGHLRGDEILRAVGEAIKAVSRTEDCCFRYGGDEFCILLPNCTETQAQSIYASRLDQEIYSREPGITISTGITQTGPVVFEEAKELIRKADENMYRVKRELKQRETEQAGVILHATPVTD